MRGFLKRFNFTILGVFILAFILGWQVGRRDVAVTWANYKPTVTVQNQEPPQNINVDFKLFWDTWNLVTQNYWNKKVIDPNKMVYGAISGMVSSLGDPYTMFLPPTQQKSSKEDLGGSFEGVGIELGFNKDNRLVVVAPLEGTPAQKAGIKASDIIVKIAGKDTTNMSLIDAVNLIRGAKGTQIALTIFREGEESTQDFNLTRDTIVVKSVQLSFKDTSSSKKIAVIKLTRFGALTNDEWNEAVSQILSEGPAGVILDVRNNPGGFLDSAVFIASEFLDGGDVVLQENSQGQRSSYKVDRVGKLLKLPVVMLINKGSASASEIVAGAMQDRKRAALVGEHSFGKGTIQDAQDLPGGTGIHITVARWLTPDGRWVNDTTGLEPDVKVEIPKPADGQPVDATQDIQLDRALEILDK
ncbi:MAG: S41 family peptidase [Candidatus Daviesbacteria bacterium]|nr:S41 family peptidase [Candidatus Daviesbacteria bacterium]